jgi:hypothetical protein
MFQREHRKYPIAAADAGNANGFVFEISGLSDIGAVTIVPVNLFTKPAMKARSSPPAIAPRIAPDVEPVLICESPCAIEASATGALAT